LEDPGVDGRIILGEEYRSLSFSLCNFLYSPVTSSLLGPNNLFSTPFSGSFLYQRIVSAVKRVEFVGDMENGLQYGW
jgi:hypothetical protein